MVGSMKDIISGRVQIVRRNDMKRLCVILMMLFIVFSLSAQTTNFECPMDGIYETTGLGWIDGVEYYSVPYSRIGVMYSSRVVYINYDWNANGDLSDEQVVTYRALYYSDCVKWETNEQGFGMTQFIYLVDTQEWRSIIEADDGSFMVIAYVLVALWE